MDGDGIFLEWSANDRRLVAYLCSDNTIMNLCAFMPSEEARVDLDTQGDSECGKFLSSSMPFFILQLTRACVGWQAVGDKESILQGFSEFTSGVQNIIQSADQCLKVWNLYDMDPLATWVECSTIGRCCTSVPAM